MPFISPEPVVRLEKHFSSAYQNFLATARTCYSSKGIITDEQIGDEWDWLAKSLYKAGHHTTLQHAHFQFTLDKVSRHVVWSFLHSHPFYNSEQVSQRYVTVKPGNITIPALEGEALKIYQECIEAQAQRYQSLCERLYPLAQIEYQKRFPSRKVESKKVRLSIKKKAQEVARYVLPVATHCYLYHTISGITLLRYWRLCQEEDVPTEQYLIVKKMVDALLDHEPKFAEILEEPLPSESFPEWQFFQNLHDHTASRRGHGTSDEFIQEFDASLQGRVSKLVDYKIQNEAVLASSVREVLGVSFSVLNDDEAIELALNPGKNRLLGESLNVTTLAKLSRCLFHASYTFRKKISHTADSQDQRHRMTPASRPILSAHLTGTPDYITPELVKQDAGVKAEYDDAMLLAWDAMNKLREQGVQEEFIQYLLPNAVSVRFTESADLLNLHHKHAMRLCYNAQEEIWRASLDEAKQVYEINPRIGKYLLPPCTLRHYAGIKPICPEGDRFCGERVWEYPLDQFERVI